ncbi:hypothetical protein EB159_03055 [archaeon]|nr:hypothetical protein [archaeon]
MQGYLDLQVLKIIGIIIIAIAILLGLSIISYTPEDYQFAQNQEFLELFDPDTSSRLVQNWLGPVGAYLSHFLVNLVVFVLRNFIKTPFLLTEITDANLFSNSISSVGIILGIR